MSAITESQFSMMRRVLGHGGRNAFVLKRGSRGRTVRALQLFLKEQGFDIKPDGVFGDETLGALKRFQGKTKLNTDGVAGSRTFRAIQRAVESMPAPEPAVTPPMPRERPQMPTSTPFVQPLPNLRPAPMDTMGTTSSAGKSMANPPMPTTRGSLLSAKDLIGPPPMAKTGPPQMPFPMAPEQPITEPPALDPMDDQVEGDVAWYRQHLQSRGADPASIEQQVDQFRQVAAGAAQPGGAMPATGPSLDFAGPQPPAAPELQGALDQRAAMESLRRALSRSILDSFIGLRMEKPQTPPPAPPTTGFSEWSI